MLIETVELTLNHVGLGTLGEVPLLTLFASAQAHLLTSGTNHTLRDVTDADGAPLYPVYLWLHLRVPPTHCLERYRVWDRVSVGVHVNRYGRMILDSTYVLGAPGALAPTVAAWDLEGSPSMRAASAWVIDGRAGEPQPSSPKAGAVAELPVVTVSPSAIARLRAVRASGKIADERSRWATGEAIAYPIRDGRDVARDHEVMFATYVEIMDMAEATLLGEQVWPRLPTSVLAHATIVEREVFFLSHTGLGKQVLVDVRVDLSPCPEDLHGPERDMISAGMFDTRYELYEAGSNKLLAVARARKLIIIPRARATVLGDLARFVSPSR